MLSRKVNILLLGETGMGKTTFVNMFPTYLSKSSFADLATQDLRWLAPARFTHHDENFVEHVIEIGEVPGRMGESETTKPETYSFNSNEWGATFNLIDTPGQGDTGGIERDKINTAAVLRYISDFRHIDGICVFLKPNCARATVLFDYCIRQILRQLHRDVKDNILFVFTRAKCTNFKLGDTKRSLTDILSKIEDETGVKIPFRDENVFCVDNEAFKYLVAFKKGYRYSEGEVEVYERSFDRSKIAVENLISYVLRLRPVKMQGVVTINESNRIVRRLAEPLINLATAIEELLGDIEKYERDLDSHKDNIQYLQRNMFITQFKQVTKERRVINKHSTHKAKVGGFFKFLVSLFVQGGATYKYDNADVETVNIYVDYVPERVVDETVMSMITDQKTAQRAVEEKKKEIKIAHDAYQRDVSVILKAMATFSTFMTQYSLMSNSDPFGNALDVAIKLADTDGNGKLKAQLIKFLEKYKILKRGINHVQLQDVKDSTEELFRLNNHIIGESLRELLNTEAQIPLITYNTIL